MGEHNHAKTEETAEEVVETTLPVANTEVACVAINSDSSVDHPRPVRQTRKRKCKL